MALLLAGVLTGSMAGGSCLEVQAAEKPVELTFYMMNSPVNDQERIMEKANEIIEEKIGAHLNLVMVDGARCV